VLLGRGHHADDLRDDVPRAAHHAVADAHVEAGDLVGIVERRIGDDHAADRDRLQPRDGGQLAGAADLDVDRVQGRLGALRPEICARAPSAAPWRPGQAALPVEPVDLVDDAVDVERQVGAARSIAR
jgi:hypothetical protein